MRTTILLLCAFALSTSALAQADANPNPDKPKRPDIATLVEFIRFEMASSVELLSKHSGKADATDLRKALQDRIDVGEAELLGAAWSLSSEGHRGKVEGIEELIYPTEFDPANSASTLTLKNVDTDVFETLPATPIAYETRNIGITLEVDPSIDPSGMIHLNLSPERVILGEEIQFHHPDVAPSAKIPIFHSTRLTTSIATKSGAYALAGVGRDPSDYLQRVFMFVRADQRGEAKELEPDSVPEISTMVEFIGADVADAVRLVSNHSGDENAIELRAAVQQLLEAGEAELLDASLVRSQSGQRASVEGIVEWVYPTEFDPPIVFGGLTLENVDTEAFKPIASSPSALETRNLGAMLEIEATLGEEGEPLVLSLASELVGLDRFTAEWPETPEDWTLTSPERMPIFHSMRTFSRIQIRNGERQLAALIPNPGKPGQHVFVFVRTDILE
ncbi:MAG: hypothetical protein ACI8UO_004296 [Verrucomicrobiales bacterium]|jgi:hypothetical protein